MGYVHVSGGSIGWLAPIPMLVAALLWISVLAGVAAPLGEWVGGNAQGSEEAVAVAGESDQSLRPELPCVCAAMPAVPVR